MLTPEEVDHLRALLTTGHTYAQIRAIMGIKSDRTIARYRKKFSSEIDFQVNGRRLTKIQAIALLKKLLSEIEKK